VTTELISYCPDHASPPGDTLAEALEEAGMSQVELARRTHLSAKHVNRLIKGHVPLSPDVATRLESVLGVPAQFWNAREANYRSRLACLTGATPEEQAWLDQLPWRELRKRGYLADTDSMARLVREVKQFFGVATVTAYSNLWIQPDVVFRLAKAHDKDPHALAAWVRITELRASAVECSPYSETAFRSVLDKIRSWTASPPSDIGVQLVRVLSNAGVAIVFEPEIQGARVSGAAYWMNDKPVIALSLRYRKDDQFWFSLFHEAGHILLHPRKQRFVDGSIGREPASEDVSDDSNAKLEREADRFAATILIPEHYDARLKTIVSLTEAEHFAKELGIAPGIVVGRLQFEGILDWSVGNRHKLAVAFA